MLRRVFFIFGFLAPVVAEAEPLTIEIYNAASPGPAALCRAAGFNTLVVGNREQLDLCRRFGFRGVIAGFPHSENSFDPEKIREKVKSVMDHPALAGYVLIDEPDLRPWSAPPSLVEEMAAAVRDIDPEHPVMATFQGFLGARALTEYLPAVDVIRLDSYPFFYGRPLTWAMEVMDACRAATGDRKPIQLIQQAWSDSERFPSPAEDLCLTYLALIHGAEGISHYAYRFKDRGEPQTLPEDEPEFWSALQAPTAHLAAISELDDPPPGARVFCTSTSGRVEWALRERGGEILLFLCNPSTIPDTAFIRPLDPAGRMASFVLGRPVEQEAGRAAVIPLRPRETRLLRISAATPQPVPENLQSILLELNRPGPTGNAYERILVRNFSAGVDDCRLLVRDEESGEVAETRTAVPARAAVERVVFATEPAGLKLARGESVGLELWTPRDELLARTIHRPAGTLVQGGAHWGEANLDGDPPLEPGREYTLRTEIHLPVGDRVASATARCFSPGTDEVLERVVSPVGNTATAEFAVKIPEAGWGERYEAAVRWVVPGVSRPGDLWIPVSIAVRPPVELEEEETVRFFDEGEERVVAFRFTPRAKTNVTGCALDAPEGWSLATNAVSVPAPGENGESVVSYAVRALENRHGRRSGGLTFRFADGGSFAREVEFSVPVRAESVPDGADFTDLATWDGVSGHRLTRGGEGDLGAYLQLAWNETEFALRCAVTDDGHFVNAGEGGVWRGDSLQVSILATPELYRTPEMGDSGFANFGFAYDDEEDRVLVDVGFTQTGIEKEAVLDALVTEGRRENGVTTYTVVIPWDSIGVDLANAKRRASFSLLVNDYDKPDRTDRHWIEFGGGIVRGTDPHQFADLRLEE